MMYRFCCLNKMRSEFTEREEAELLNSHFAPVFLSSEQMRVSIYRDKYIKISHLFIYLFFSNHVHVCFKPLPSGRKEVLGKTYSQSSLGSQTHNPRAMSRLQGLTQWSSMGGGDPLVTEHLITQFTPQQPVLLLLWLSQGLLLRSSLVHRIILVTFPMILSA